MYVHVHVHERLGCVHQTDCMEMRISTTSRLYIGLAMRLYVLSLGVRMRKRGIRYSVFVCVCTYVSV